MAQDEKSKHTPSIIHEPVSDPGWAWSLYESSPSQPWNLRFAAHLYRRTTFGATWKQLQQALTDGPQRTIDRLMQPDANINDFNQTYDKYESSATDSESTDTLRAWWLRRMLHTPHPLLEKMTLFWHNHFAVSNGNVKSARMMKQYIQQLRGHALGSFESLLDTIVHEPALFAGLGAEKNRKAQPCEDFARVLLETYCLGRGHCSERDIHEVARAFTGWFVLRDQIRFIPHEQDEGVKEILGNQGTFNSHDVVRILLRQPALSQWLIRKLYRFFISEIDEPSDSLMAPLVEVFIKNYDISQVLNTMLRSNLFFSAMAYRRRIKSPVELGLGIAHGLEADVSTSQLGDDLKALGQNLFHPPTANGWIGGRNWINNATMISRINLATMLLETKGTYDGKINPAAIAEHYGYHTAEAAHDFILDLFIQNDYETGDIFNCIKNRGNDPRALRTFTQRVITSPEFQLA